MKQTVTFLRTSIYVSGESLQTHSRWVPETVPFLGRMQSWNLTWNQRVPLPKCGWNSPGLPETQTSFDSDTLALDLSCITMAPVRSPSSPLIVPNTLPWKEGLLPSLSSKVNLLWWQLQYSCANPQLVALEILLWICSQYLEQRWQFEDRARLLWEHVTERLQGLFCSQLQWSTAEDPCAYNSVVSHKPSRKPL